MHSLETGIRRAVLLAAVLAMAAYPLVSQERTAAIAGSVQDEFGAAVGDAQIKLKSIDGTVEVQAVSTADGHFAFTDVRPRFLYVGGGCAPGKTDRVAE